VGVVTPQRGTLPLGHHRAGPDAGGRPEPRGGASRWAV